MKYRLRNQELQKKLDELSGGVFSRRLNDTAHIWANDPDVASISWETGLEKQTIFKVWISRSDIEEITGYDPHAWNEFPDVTPPQGIPMRVEVSCSRCGFKAQFIDGQWWDMRGDALFDGPEGDGIEGRVVRFRPWEDKCASPR